MRATRKEHLYTIGPLTAYERAAWVWTTAPRLLYHCCGTRGAPFVP